MKQVVQNYKTGEVSLREVGGPLITSKRILVRNQYSLISMGTEKSVIELGKKSLLGKAAHRPDLLKRAIDKARKEGFRKTWQEAMGRLDTPTPLGYSSSGIVCDVGEYATEFSPGERVACIGQGFASHAEYISVPVNMAVKLPSNVNFDEASFGMLGIIALHGVRKAQLSFGSSVVVKGLGLIGLLTCKILTAYGCRVIGQDPDVNKIALAEKIGITTASSDSSNVYRMSQTITKGVGVDAVLITAASQSPTLVNESIELCRRGGRIVVVGTADIHPDRNELWRKEIEIVVSRAGGAGSLDPAYEIEGNDIHPAETRWTQKRNLEEFIRLVSIEAVKPRELITHRYPISDAVVAYDSLLKGELASPIGVILEYPKAENPRYQSAKVFSAKNDAGYDESELNVSVIGAGLFAKSLMLPELERFRKIKLHTLVTSNGINAEHISSRFKFVAHSTEESDVWDSAEVKAVMGFTPHSNHAHLIRQAYQTGKSLFIEKPMCISEAELRQIESYAASAKTSDLIFVGHNRKYSPHIRRIGRWLDERAQPAVLVMTINAGFVSSDHWVHSEAQGRSRIVGEMSHFVNLICVLLRSRVETVFASRVSADNKTMINNDNIVVNFKLVDGSIASLVYSGSGCRAYPRETTEIFFDGKVIRSVDFMKSELFGPSKRLDIFRTRGQELGYKQEIEQFFSLVAIKNYQGQAESLMDENIHDMKVIFAIEKSLSSGHSVIVKT